MSKEDMSDYREKPSTTEQQAEHYEKEPENPEVKTLDVDDDVVVPTGDEEMPVSGDSHTRSIKSIYKNSKKNRDKIVAREATEHPDVDMIEAMIAETAGGEVPEHGVDTNRDARAPEPEHETEPEVEAQQEAQPTDSPDPEQVDSAPDALPKPRPNAKVEVKVLGETYSVPQQDVDDAGGIESYQKLRAANIRLERAAILEKRARQAQQEASEAQQEPHLPTSDGDRAKADSSKLREELLDVVANGSEEDIDGWLESQLKSASSREQRDAAEQTAASVRNEMAEPSETEKELEQLRREEVAEANRMMSEQYQDIMSDPDLFRSAQHEFQHLVKHPSSRGRTQAEIAREAAETVRQRNAERMRGNIQADPVEQERQTRIERKRALPQTSRASQRQAPTVTQEKRPPSAKEHIERLRRRAGVDYTPDR